MYGYISTTGKRATHRASWDVHSERISKLYLTEDLISLLSGHETKKVFSLLHESVKSFGTNGSREIQRRYLLF